MEAMESVGVIGGGFVGTALARGFIEFTPVKVYDIDPTRSTHPLDEVLASDIVFVCLPTPMTAASGGGCDLSIIDNFFASVAAKQRTNINTLFVIKSTVPLGTTRRIQKILGNDLVVHNPEFLTARIAMTDFLIPARQIIGATDACVGLRLEKLLKARFPSCPIHRMQPEESELVKYIANCFFATKVSYFNEMRLLVDKMGLDWQTVLDGVMSDGRIAYSHQNVPGPDGKRGFSGTCFPKDINALIETMEANGIDPLVLKAVWQQNLHVRPELDWGKSPSAVTQKPPTPDV